MDDDRGRLKALEELNKPLMREGYEAFYGDDRLCIYAIPIPKRFQSVITLIGP